MKELKITNLKKNEKVLYYIKSFFPNLSVSALHKAFRNKDIKVNGKRINDVNYEIKNDDTVQIYLDDSILYNFPKELQIAYQDENLVVVNKPQGILSNNEEINQSEPTFEDYVKSKLGENIKICHRLDRNTGGLLVFSKNDISYNSLLNAFKNGYIYKEYTAYVVGTNFDKTQYHYENYLLKDNKTGYSKIYPNKIDGAAKIVTDIAVFSTSKNKNYSILKVLIHTGKTHQIRALLSYISHPIIGDSKYGKNEINKKFKKYKQLLFATKYTFCFPKDDTLSYLNDLTINLDKAYYIVEL